MAVYVVTGKLGSGKTLACVARLTDEYLRKGRKVATNLDLYLENLLPKKHRATVTRIPDKPRIEDLQALGTGDGRPIDQYDESRFGALILDECASWLNTRQWNDKGRHALMEWFIHARKYHWDIYLIIQDIEALDKQVRQALCEHLVICYRADRLALGWLGSLWKLFTGHQMRLPRFHRAKVYYGDSRQAPRADGWWYRGDDYILGYRTGQVFSDQVEIHGGELLDMRASYTILSPWHLVGRYDTRPTLWQQLVMLCILPIRLYMWAVIRLAATVQGRSPWAVAADWHMLTPEARRRVRQCGL
jgi:hypothetical protein